MPAPKMIHGAKVKQASTGTKPSLKWLAGPAPEDPDAGFTFQITAEAWRKKMAIPLVSNEKEGIKAARVFGNVATMELTGKNDANGRPQLKCKMNRVESTEGLRKLLDSDVFKRSRYMETRPFGRETLAKTAWFKEGMRESYDPFALGNDNLTSAGTNGWPPNNEYVPILGGPFNKQLYLTDYLEMWARCFEAKNHNPVMKEVVDVISFFSMGKGVQLKFNNPQVQDAWGIFDKRNKFSGPFLRMDSDTLTWGGEVMTHKTVFPDGFPRLRHIDPSGVWEIVTNPRDIEEVFYYHQQFPTQWQLVYKPGDVGSEYVIEDIPAEEVIHMKINCVPGEKRGRSDLFAVLGWGKRLKDYYDARITKAQVEESFCIDVTIDGSPADVAGFIADPDNNRVPRPGDKLVHNKAVEFNYKNPTSSSSGNAIDSIGEAIRSLIATGVGLSPEYLGVGGKSGNRASSITKSEPSARKFEDRQERFKGYITEIVEWWQHHPGAKLPTTQVRPAAMTNLKAALSKRDLLGVAKEAAALIGFVNVTEPIDLGFQVIFPEIGTEDRTAKLKDIAQSQALQYLSRERAATMTATELGIDDYDFDEEQEKIREERLGREQDPAYSGEADPAMDLLGKGGLNAAPASGQPGSQASDQAHQTGSPDGQGSGGAGTVA